MSKKLAYVIGAPASGKSTAVANALRGVQPLEEERQPFPYTVYKGGIQLGANREGHSGTDAMGYTVLPKVLSFLKTTEYDNVIGEGDRLTNKPFFNSVIEQGWDLEIIYFSIPDYIAQRRRYLRGTKQNEIWANGRATKVKNIVKQFSKFIHEIDATDSKESVGRQLRERSAFRGIFIRETVNV